MRQSLRVVFAGTPAFGLPALKALYDRRHHLCSVYTQPDRPAGRGRKIQMSPIKEWAVQQQVPVVQPVNFKDPETIEALAAVKPDVMVVIAYGLLLPKTVLDIPRLGCVNVHASLLPRWRGASPIQHAIVKGDVDSGVTIMQMDIGMDTGDMLQKVSCPINPQDTAGTLHDRLSHLAVAPLLSCLDDLAAGTANAKPQDGALATYAPKIQKEDARIDWKKEANAIDRQVRGFNPWPVAFTETTQGSVLRVLAGTPLSEDSSPASAGTLLSVDPSGLRVACGKGVYLVEQLQFSGRNAMSVAQWLNGRKDELIIGASFR